MVSASKVLLTRRLASLVISLTAIVEASDDSFNTITAMFAYGGITTRTACGNTTRRIDIIVVIPIDFAASTWPLGTDSRPDLYISAKYVEYANDKPITAA